MIIVTSMIMSAKDVKQRTTFEELLWFLELHYSETWFVLLPTMCQVQSIELEELTLIVPLSTYFCKISPAGTALHTALSTGGDDELRQVRDRGSLGHFVASLWRLAWSWSVVGDKKWPSDSDRVGKQREGKANERLNWKASAYGKH